MRQILKITFKILHNTVVKLPLGHKCLFVEVVALGCGGMLQGDRFSLTTKTSD